MGKKYQKVCRLCGSSNLLEVIKLEDSPLCDEYLKKEIEQSIYPLGLNLCSICNFVQLNFVIPPEIIYKNYIYVTTSSHGLEKHFKKYVSDVTAILKLKSKKLVVDIGSNDGTLLGFFKKKGHNVIGVEPASETAKKANQKNINTLDKFFDMQVSQHIVETYGHAEIVTINNLFANIVDLNFFMEAIDKLLDKNGVLIIESSYLYKMMDNMVFDFIYHEHLSYLSVSPLIRWLKSKNLKIIFIQDINTKGGSLRYYISRDTYALDVDFDIDTYLIEEEKGKKLEIIFKKFQDAINFNGMALTKILENYKGKKIVGYGASATSTTLISQYKLYDYIDYLIDDNEMKINTYSPKYHIPVFSIEHLKNNKPDVIIILAWRYKNEIIKKLKNFKIPIIIPLPEAMIEN